MSSALFAHIMKELRKRAVYQSPLRIFIILLITIFAAETFIMILLRFLAVRFWVEAFRDSSFLTIMLFPVFYFFVFRPSKLYISELKQGEESLKQSEEKYRLLVENIPAVAYIGDAEGKTIFITPNVEKVYGYTPEEIYSGGSDIWLGRIHTEDLEYVKKEYGLFFKENKPLDVEYRIRRKDDEWIWLHDRVISSHQEKGILYIYGLFSDVSERKKAEAAIVRAEAKLRTLFDSFPDAIFIVNMEGRFLDVNQAACERLGYSHGELLQMGPADIDAPEYAAKVPERIKTMLEQDSLIFESAHVRRDGIVIPIELNGRVIEYDGRPTIIGIARDITERKKAEAQIKDSEERFRNLAEQSPNMIFINKRGKVVYVNAKCEEVMKYKRVEFYSPDFDFLCLIAPEFVELARSKLDKHQRSEEVEPVEYAIVSKDGKRIEVILNSRLIYHEGEKAILGIITDITELKNAEDKLKKALQELEAAQEASLNIMEDLESERRKLESSLKEREALLRELHHRVKNNMQIMSSLMRLQARTIAGSPYSGMFKDALDRIKAMSLIHEKLYGSKDMRRIGFRDYIRSLAGDLFQTYDIAGGRISLKTDIETPDIDIDKAIPLGLIINELITNSIKYAFPGDRTGEIIITIQPVSENKVELLVADNGIGIPGAFDVRNIKTLGLQMVTTLAEDQLRGSMEISRNNGTEFRIRFKI